MRRVLWIGILVAACGAGGCATSPEGVKQLNESYTAFGNKDDQTVVRDMDAFLKSNNHSDRADEAYYLRGLSKQRMKDSASAKSDLSEAVTRTKRPELKANAYMALGDLAYDADDMNGAQSMYTQALAGLDRGQKPADHAQYRLGCVLQREGKWSEADEMFDRVSYAFRDIDPELARRSANRTHCRAWTVQMGSYARKDLADNAVAGMKARGLQASDVPMERDGLMMFLVQIGRYQTYEQANAMLSKAKELRGDAFLITTR